ncbi:MAG: hypothetical protein UT32_C0003G0012 [Parcubacteria group bacterium GW2011_GWC2_39_14]|nr:MAG: hypothetical protein UT32_C0003G0012 [Parcubacteria group bacterium GW2011_GWC2_39_14]KKR54961.1 MAG: hypothetical protein UT91_C0006G0012 [Parcubacteria group bacterium GW2011_GWA2_40_23]
MAKKLRVSKSDEIEFCELMGLLLSSGVPILDVFDTLATHFERESSLGRAILRVKQGVCEGKSMSVPMEEMGFANSLCATVTVGEANGLLDTCFIKYAVLLREPKHSDEKKFFQFFSFFLDLGLNTQKSLMLTAEHFGNAFYKRIMQVVQHIDNRQPLARALKLEGFSVVACCLVSANSNTPALNRYADLIS